MNLKSKEKELLNSFLKFYNSVVEANSGDFSKIRPKFNVDLITTLGKMYNTLDGIKDKITTIKESENEIVVLQKLNLLNDSMYKLESAVYKGIVFADDNEDIKDTTFSPELLNHSLDSLTTKLDEIEDGLNNNRIMMADMDIDDFYSKANNTTERIESNSLSDQYIKTMDSLDKIDTTIQNFTKAKTNITSRALREAFDSIQDKLKDFETNFKTKQYDFDREVSINRYLSNTVNGFTIFNVSMWFKLKTDITMSSLNKHKDDHRTCVLHDIYTNDDYVDLAMKMIEMLNMEISKGIFSKGKMYRLRNLPDPYYTGLTNFFGEKIIDVLLSDTVNPQDEASEEETGEDIGEDDFSGDFGGDDFNTDEDFGGDFGGDDDFGGDGFSDFDAGEDE